MPDGLEAPRRHWATFILLLAIGITVLDGTMVNVALPEMSRSLNIDPANVVWVVIAYSLVVVSSLLPLSAMAERVGFRRVFVLGMVLYMLSSLAAALADSLLTLVAARMAQGFSAAMLMCLFGGFVRNIYPLSKLAIGISYNALVVGVTAVLGPTIGAFILAVASWNWIFIINIPLCLIAVAGVRVLPEIPTFRGRFDWVACMLSIPFFGLSIAGLDLLAKAPGWGLLFLVGAAVAGSLLVRRSRGQTAPLMPIDLLAIKPISYAVAASVFSFAAQMGAFVALPFYFQKVLQYSYVDVGILLGAWSVGVAVMAPVAAVLSGRYQVAWLCLIGAGGMAVGLGWLLLMDPGVAFVWPTIAMLLGGIGFGFFQTPNNRVLLGAAPRNRSGAAGAVQATTRVFGQSFGTALVGVAFSLASTHAMMLGVLVGVACAVVAMAINVARLMDPVRDEELS